MPTISLVPSLRNVGFSSHVCASSNYLFIVSTLIENTRMWQSSNYLTPPDSGIQTGIVTQTPSVMGNDEDMERDLFDLDQNFQQGFTQEQVDGKIRTKPV